MIEINKIEDLKPFIKYVDKKYTNGIYPAINFEFKIHGELQDVEIKCDLQLIEENMNIFYGELDDVLSLVDIDEGYCVNFFAKNVYAKKIFDCEHLKCENFYIEKESKVDFLVVADTIKGRILKAQDIFCDNLDIDIVDCSFLNALNVKAKVYKGKGAVFTNVEYHNPDFPKELVESWGSNESKPYGIVYQHDRLLF
ncbi:MAG: hypothetical protein E7354_04425 [Clostridiales bacterium]|nr:hypothetical protein [Clostridiales bacterium]